MTTTPWGGVECLEQILHRRISKSVWVRPQTVIGLTRIVRGSSATRYVDAMEASAVTEAGVIGSLTGAAFVIAVRLGE